MNHKRIRSLWCTTNVTVGGYLEKLIYILLWSHSGQMQRYRLVVLLEAEFLKRCPSALSHSLYCLTHPCSSFILFVIFWFQVRGEWGCEFHSVSARFSTQRAISAIFEDVICHETVSEALELKLSLRDDQYAPLYIFRYVLHSPLNNIAQKCM